MSKKQKPDPKIEQTKSLEAVRAPSVGESALTSEATSLMDWIKKGDYTTRPKNLFFNFADPAARARKRELMMNSRPQGIAALGMGATNPNLLALNRQNLNDEWARDEAAQYEADVAGAQARATGMLGSIAGLENQRELGALAATSGAYNTQLGKPSWWQTLLGNAAQGAAIGLAGSDARAKDDIVPIADALDKVGLIHGVSYRWNDNALHLGQEPGTAGMGVLAQDVERVFPSLVQTGGDGFKRVDYAGLIGVLFAAVNDLHAKVRELSTNLPD